MEEYKSKLEKIVLDISYYEQKVDEGCIGDILRCCKIIDELYDQRDEMEKKINELKRSLEDKKYEQN